MATAKLRNKGLTVKQERFCIEFAKSGDSREAVKAAGYAWKNNASASVQANALLKHPDIQARLAELQQKTEDESIASIKEIKQKLTAILRQFAEEEVLVTEGVEKGVTETKRYLKKADLRTVTKAAELLAKMGGAFTENVNIQGGVKVVISDDLKE